MIGYVKGNLLSYGEGFVLLENNGIGYEITCSNAVYQKILQNNGGEVYTYLAVREDGISLYGFIDANEKDMFLKLISVSGVGPKMGITILSQLKREDIAVKIATSDVKGLSQVKGLGKKTAERIILELREKMGAIDLDSGEILSPITESVSIDQDALIALTSLGFTKSECEKVLSKAQREGVTGVEKLIAYALKNIK